MEIAGMLHSNLMIRHPDIYCLDGVFFILSLLTQIAYGHLRLHFAYKNHQL